MAEKDMLINFTNDESHKESYFLNFAQIPRFLSLSILGLTFWWVYLCEGGLGFDDGGAFGWHAIFMVFAFIVWSTEAFLSFRYPLFPSSHNSRKLKHLLLHFLSLLCIVTALVGIVEYKKFSPLVNNTVVFPNNTLYSPHSWIGILVLTCWVFQIIIGLVGGYILTSQSQKAILFRLHKFIGKMVYILGLCTCALGFQNMQSSDLSGAGYLIYSWSSLMSPLISILIVFLGIIMFALLEYDIKEKTH